MKTLILSYSHSGNNRLLARELSRQLKSDWEEIKEKGKRGFFRIATERMFGRKAPLIPLQKDPLSYDQVILVGPTWMGKLCTPLTQILKDMDLKNYSLITLNGGATGPNPDIWDGLTPSHTAQLFINDLLPADKKGQMMETARFQISGDELPSLFTPKIHDFVEKIKA